MGHLNIKEEDKPEEETKGYMVGVEWLYHLGNDIGGATIYPSIQDLYDAHSYMTETEFPQDGIIEVKVDYIKHIMANQCWQSRQKEIDHRIMTEKLLKDGGCIRIGNMVIKANALIEQLKREGFL